MPISLRTPKIAYWNRRTALVISLVLMIATVLVASPLHAVKKTKEKPRKGQTGLSFTNDTGQTVYGLTVQLNQNAGVVTDSENHRVGPFFSVKGNESQKLTFTSPVAPIESDSESFEVVFRSYKSGLKITKYWWLDQKGKQVGEKLSP